MIWSFASDPVARPVVIRVKKLATMGQVAASGSHTWRERPTPNADPARTHLNEDLRPVSSSADLRAAVEQRLATVTDTTAKNPVRCIEYLVTAHRDAFSENGGTVDSAAYLRDALAWIERKHGAANVVAVNVQRDELAPHLVAYVVPLVEVEAKTRKRSVIVGTNPDGTKRRETRTEQQDAAVRLSAAHYIDGRAKLSKLQTDFAAEVGQRHGLVRGVEGSKARHTTVKEFYSALSKVEPVPVLEVPEPTMADRLNPRAYAERSGEVLIKQMEPERAALRARAATADIDRKRAAEMTATAKALQDKLAPLAPILDLAKLNPKLVQKLVDTAKEWGQRVIAQRTAAKAQDHTRAAPSRGKGPER